MTGRNTKEARILVVDDDPTARLIAGRTLIRDGHAVESCADGEAALEAFHREPPDLVILDVQMPGVDGFAVCEEIRAHPDGERIPIVMMTGLGDVDSIQTAYDAGATDFISKPIQWMILCQRVRYLLRSKATLEELEEHRTSLAHAQALARIGSFRLDFEDRVARISAELERMWGLPSPVGFETLRQLGRRTHREDRGTFNAETSRCLRERVPVVFDYRFESPDGKPLTLRATLHPVIDPDHEVVGIEGTIQDVTEQVQADAQIRFLSHHDPLTGLSNRRTFERAIDEQAQYTLESGIRSGVLLMNLDQFRRVNDSFGHSIGDELLRNVANRIVDEVRRAFEDGGRGGEPRVGRLVGDEIAILVPAVHRSQELAGVARRIQHRLARPFSVEGTPIVVGASVGIAVCPDDGDAAELLLRHADHAVQVAKSTGGGGIQFFAPEMNESASRRIDTERILRDALASEGLVLHYQPRVAAEHGRVVGFEALVRLQDPQRGLVMPGEFVGVAEETGMIEPLTEWVIRTACRQAVAWRARGLDEVAVSTNVSPLLFRRAGLTDQVQRILDETGCPADALCIEITESALLHDAVAVSRELEALRALGVCVSLDDFGTGYSSLAYLRELPVDQLKIDRAFIGADRERRPGRAPHRGDHRDGSRAVARHGCRRRRDRGSRHASSRRGAATSSRASS